MTGVQLGPVGFLISRRFLLAAAVTLSVILTVAGLALTTGRVHLSLGDIVEVLAGGGSGLQRLVVDQRLGRLAAALLVGFALGMSGALTQTITRNPIASPDILGVTAGAGLFAVLTLTQITPSGIEGIAGSALITAAALGGAALTTCCVLLLAWRGGFDGLRLVLVGLSVNSLALAGTSWLLIRTDLIQAQVAHRWLVGSVTGVHVNQSVALLAVCALATVAVTRLLPGLRCLRLGRELATTLGHRGARIEGWCLMVAVVLAAAATAVAGPIGFVAFAAPQIALRLFGTAGPPPIAGGLIGAALVLACDLLAARLPGDLPAGVVTAAVGAAYLLILLTRRHRRSDV